jgi:hypothetical protein
MQQQPMLYILLINLAIAIPVVHAHNGTSVSEPSIVASLARNFAQDSASSNSFTHNDWRLTVLRNREGNRVLITMVYRGDLETLPEGQRAWFLFFEEGEADPTFSTWAPGMVPFDVRNSGAGFSVMLFDSVVGEAAHIHIGRDGDISGGPAIQMVTQPEDMPEGAGGG